MADEPYDPGVNSTTVSQGDGSTTTAAPYDPGVSSKSVLQTSYHTLPSDTRGGSVKEDWGTIGGLTTTPTEGAPTRIRQAVREGWEGGSSITPEWQEKMNAAPGPFGWVNRNIVNPALNTAGGAVRAVGAGVGATVGELADAAGVPELGRDINLGAPAVAPLVMAAGPLRGPALTAAPKAEPLSVPPSVVTPDALATAEARANARAATIPPGTPRPTAPVDTGIPGPISPPAGYQPPFNAATTAAEAFGQAKKLYATADATGGQIASNANDRFVTQLAKDHPPDPQVQKFNRGPTLVDQTVTDFNNAMQGQNLSLQTFQGIDKAIGDRIGEALNAGNKEQASALMDMRDSLRSHVENATQSDVVGGNATGFQALSDARQAWSTAVRMQDIERMRQRALDAGATGGNTAQSFKSQVRSFLANDKNTRGWSDAELSALRSAANTGTWDEIYRTLGSRLVPIAATATGGIAGGIASGAAQAAVSSLMRDAMANRTLNRVSGLLGTIGRGMPQAQGVPGPNLIPRVSALPQPGYMTGLLGSSAFPPSQSQ